MYVAYYVDADGRGKWFTVNGGLNLDTIDPSDCEWLVPGTYTEE